MSTWKIDPTHSLVEFSVKHMMFSTVKGRFGALEGSVTLPDSGYDGLSIDVTIDATSVDTRSEDRDKHLRSQDFFHVEQHPHLTFKSKKVEHVGGDKLKVVGDLTIRGTTKEVVLEANDQGRGTDPWGNQRAGFSASATIDRRDFDLTWNSALEKGGVLVGHDVKISVEAQLVQQK